MSKRHEIGAFRATWNSFFNVNASYFPRFRDADGKYEQIDDEQIIHGIAQSLANVAPPADPKPYLDRGRETLNEVKSLTEYQDQKVTRLLTIVAFLSALSGALFSRFADAYPLQASLTQLGWSGFGLLIGSAYASFGLFALTAVGGALVVFHATRTRFRYPDPDPVAPGAAPRKPDSYLFFPGIIKVTPVEWARSFLSPPPAGSNATPLDPGLPMHYMKNYILESYLVAAKVADKLRYLQPAQNILAFSVRMLLIWVILFAATLIAVPSTATRPDPPAGPSHGYLAPHA